MDKNFELEIAGIENRIMFFRGHRVIIDDFLARIQKSLSL